MNDELLAWLSSVKDDPLAFTMGAYPWGEEGTSLAKFDGPDEWSKELMGQIKAGLPIDQAIQIAVASGHGIGKAQLLDEVVPTPTGYRIWGELQVGDQLFGADGSPVTISATKHFNQIPWFRVTFDDGSYTDVSEGHLWNVRGRQERRTNTTGWRTLSTLDIIKLGVTRSNGEFKARQWEIPIQGPAQYQRRELAVHPYVMGLWLSDGTVNKNQITQVYQGGRDRLTQLNIEWSETDWDSRVIKIHDMDRSHGVFRLNSHERYIPEDYLCSSIEDRLLLFQGLCDGDGEAHSSGSIGYCTTSQQLAGDVIELARSLGYKASLHDEIKWPYYRDADGELVEGKGAYRITINADANPFSLEHRRIAWKESGERYRKRWIDSIEPLGLQDGMCVTVSSPDGLYQTNNFIVTHNSATVAWIILWAFCTYPDCRGVITANTETQLKTKTWAEAAKWFNLCFFARDHFNLTATALFTLDPERALTWRIDMVPWSKTNPAAWQGLHNQGKRCLIIFDEASEIADKIWETAGGAMSDIDTQRIFLAFGNPTQNIGMFRECFDGGRFADEWSHRQIDSRTVRITDKRYIDGKIKAYGGLDNDIIRVRWLGQFPLKGMLEFFSALEIDEAMSRETPYVDRETPLAIGVDVARFGANNSVIFSRKGRDARTIDRRSYNGLSTVELSNRIFDIFHEYRPDGIFIDEGGVGGGVVDQCREKRLFVLGVQFGGKDDISGVSFDTQGERYANKRAAMYGAVRAWLKTGALPPDPQLKNAMLAIRYGFNKQDQIQLVSKEDLMSDNPGLVLDDLDALALTFGGPLAASANAGGDFPHEDLVVSDWNPYEPERMVA
jgi:hypothetical protein